MHNFVELTEFTSQPIFLLVPKSWNFARFRHFIDVKIIWKLDESNLSQTTDALSAAAILNNTSWDKWILHIFCA